MDERTIIVKRGGGFGTFLRGALIGAGLAMLFAPRSGRETREMLTERSVELRDKATDIARDTRVRAEEALVDARNRLDERLQGVKSGIHQDANEVNKQLKRELEISEDIENPIHPL
jgi:gas vesicle protein